MFITRLLPNRLSRRRITIIAGMVLAMIGRINRRRQKRQILVIAVILRRALRRCQIPKPAGDMVNDRQRFKNLRSVRANQNRNPAKRICRKKIRAFNLGRVGKGNVIINTNLTK